MVLWCLNHNAPQLKRINLGLTSLHFVRQRQDLKTKLPVVSQDDYAVHLAEQSERSFCMVSMGMVLLLPLLVQMSFPDLTLLSSMNTRYQYWEACKFDLKSSWDISIIAQT